MHNDGLAPLTFVSSHFRRFCLQVLQPGDCER